MPSGVPPKIGSLMPPMRSWTFMSTFAERDVRDTTGGAVKAAAAPTAEAMIIDCGVHDAGGVRGEGLQSAERIGTLVCERAPRTASARRRRRRARHDGALRASREPPIPTGTRARTESVGSGGRDSP